MRIESVDIRHGDDAAFYLLVRTGLRSAADVATLGVLDLAAIALTIAAVRVLAGFGLVPPNPPGAPMTPLFAYAVLCGLAGSGAYRAGDQRRSALRIAGAVTMSGIALSAAATFAGWGVAWEHMAALTGGVVVAVLETRLLGERLTRFVRSRAPGGRRVVLVGCADSTDAGRLRAAAGGIEVCGRLGAHRDDGAADGHVEELSDFLARCRVDAVVVTEPLAPAAMGGLVEAAFRRGTRVEAWYEAVRDGNRVATVRVEEGRPVVEWRPARPGLPRMAIKRGIDVGFTTLALLLMSPLLAVIAVAIRLDSPGPVFFGQLRVGVGGKPFRMWKFRTMVPDADRLKPALAEMNESGDPRLFKISRDPRVTRVGHWLRRMSLDELPQLVNVLRGEMSLVGPRPFFPEDVESYESHHLERLTVLPGITGLWQVSGRSDIQDFEAVVSLDRDYIRRWSIGLDLRILAKTIPAVLRRDGAM